MDIRKSGLRLNNDDLGDARYSVDGDLSDDGDELANSARSAKSLQEAGKSGSEGELSNAEDSKKNSESEEGVTFEEDSNRKIKRLLEEGDIVLESHNTARVLGLDLCGMFYVNSLSFTDWILISIFLTNRGTITRLPKQYLHYRQLLPAKRR